MTNNNKADQPDYDEDGIQWFPSESFYAAPDRVAQQPPNNDLSDLRDAVERGERLHWHTDETGFSSDGSFAAQRTLDCNTVVIAKECLRGDEHNEDDDTDT